ncbi:autotransporter domain-containing protein [Ignatzschineria sp. LJL83]
MKIKTFKKLPLFLALSAILTTPILMAEDLTETTIFYDGTDTSVLNPGGSIIPTIDGINKPQDNNVIIDFDATDDSIQAPVSVYGGYSNNDNATVKNNKVTIHDGRITGALMGSHSEITPHSNPTLQSAIAEGTLTIHQGEFGGRVMAANTSIQARVIGDGLFSLEATGNLTVNGGTFKDIVAGAGSTNQKLGSAISNATVNISGGQFSQMVYGAHAAGNANRVATEGIEAIANGTINFSGGIIDRNMYASYINSAQKGESTAQLTISGGEIKGHVYSAYGSALGINMDSSSIIAKGSVNMSDGVVGGLLVAGYANSFQESEATGSIVMTGGHAKTSVYGAYSTINATTTLENRATAFSELDISNSTIDQNVIGSIAITHHKAEAQSIISLQDSHINGDIVGANVSIHDNPVGTDPVGTIIATNNQISLDGQITLGPESSIWGANINGAAAYKNAFTGNVLNIRSNPLSVAELGNFENYNFYLTKNNDYLVNSDTAMITVTKQLHNEDTWDNIDIESPNDKNITHNKSLVLLKGISGENSVKAGDSILLLSATDALLTQGNWNTTDGTQTPKDFLSDLIETGEKHELQMGLANKIHVEYEIDDITQQVSAKFLSDKILDDYLVERNIKPLVEGRISALMNVTRKSDLATGIIRDLKEDQVTPFVTVKGGRDRYQSGSHITANMFDLLMGAGYRSENLSIAGFATYGYDDYKTYNYFADGEVKGKGHNSSYGLGFAGTYDFTNEFYADFGMQVGRINTKFNSSDIITGSGEEAHYKSKVTYFGGYLGAGYRYALDDTSNLNTSIRYLYSHLGSDGITIDGDAIQFKSLKSSRLELKTQYEKVYSEQMTFNTSLAYQYEFDGKGDANIAGISIDAPGMKGSTGLVGVGFEYQPKSDDEDSFLNRSKINMDVQGYFGKRRGGSVSLTYRYMLK